MARPLRIEFPGAIYHVMSHGNGRQWIYKDAEDLDLFVTLLDEVIKKYGVVFHAVTLMRNHYHLLVETPHPNLARCMQRFNSEFARRMNSRVDRRGSVFRSHYKAILIEKDRYYETVFRYICQNPVRAGLVSKAEEYPGSSLAWFADPDRKHLIEWDRLYLPLRISSRNIRPLLEWINGEMETRMPEKMPHPHLLGSEEWVERILEQAKSEKERKEQEPPSLDEQHLRRVLLRFPPSLRRAAELHIRYRCTDATLKELAETMEFPSVEAANQALHRFRIRIKGDADRRKVLERLRLWP